MLLPTQPITLTAEQVKELNGKLKTMRHDVNNKLALIVAAVELIRLKPHTTANMLATLVEQPPKISEALTTFSAEFERACGITRG